MKNKHKLNYKYLQGELAFDCRFVYYCLILIIFFFCPKICFSQADTSVHFVFKEIKYGLFYNYSVVNTNARITNFPEVKNYPLGTATHTGFGDFYGIFILAPIYKNASKYTDVGVRVAFINNVFDMQFPNYDSDTKTTGLTSINNSFEWFSITPIIQSNLFGELVASFGVQLNLPVVAEGIFNYNLRNAEQYPVNFINPRIQLGLSYPIQIGGIKFLSIIPEVHALLGITNDVGGDFNDVWKTNFFSFGLALQYDRGANEFIETKTLYDYNVIVDTVKRIAKTEEPYFRKGKYNYKDSTKKQIDKQTSLVTYFQWRVDTMFLPSMNMFEIDAKIIAYDKEGDESRVFNNYEINVDETYVLNENQPLLSYIFFELGSDKIPNRYTLMGSSNNQGKAQSALNMDIKNFKVGNFGNVLDAYYQILNIIGKRMQENESYSLKIVGCNDNVSTEEKDNLTLSNARAIRVKEYLEQVWHIAPNRLTTDARGLPSSPSLKENEPLKMQENRRVELIPNDESLLAPVINTSHQLKASVEKFNLYAECSTREEIQKYSIIIKSGEDIINSYTVDDPPYKNGIVVIDEDFTLDFSNIRANKIYTITLLVTNSSNNTKSYKATILVNFVSADQLNKNNNTGQIDKSYLILFDLKDAQISQKYTHTIKEILSSINSNTECFIVGYTDINGKDSFNSKLALQRGDAVKKALSLSNTVVDSDDKSLLFDNNTPEGRFYSRAVEITIVNVEQLYPD